MTDTLHLLRENTSVESVDQAFEAAYAWIETKPDWPNAIHLMAAFAAGAKWQREDIAERLEALIRERTP